MTTHKTVRAFAPASISCFFKVYKHTNPRWAGSYGMGFTVDKGVIATVMYTYSSSEAKRSREVSSRQSRTINNEIYFNNKPINFPTVRSVLTILGVQPLKVVIKSDLPLGCGFGLSGASALATAYAVNELLKLKKSNKALAIVAHTAEVENKTGLGDVVNQYYGGFVVKFWPSSQFVVKKLPFENVSVYCRYFSSISTKSILESASIKKQINNAGTKALARIKNVQAFSDAIAIGKEFVVTSGLLRDKKTKETIESIEKNGGVASMIILGNAVYSNLPFPGAMKLYISNRGAHLL